ncbi:MAG: mechanosensitive ion channel family protein [Melioribacteraceae bacterium]|nr:mechanosensitive ion channel family protein [Melioribacteraceae bacterium]
MRIPRTSSFLIPSVLFFGFLFLSRSGYFNYPDDPQSAGVMMDKVFYYFINSALWISAAFLFNLIMKTFFWDGLVRFKAGSVIGKTVIDFTSVLIYCVALAVILIGVIKIEYSVTLLLLLLSFLFIASVFRSKFLSLLSTKYLSSEHPFNLGDWIDLINKDGKTVVTGEVYDISRKGTRIKTEENTIALIPNRLLEEEYIIKNYWGSNRETEFNVHFTVDFNVPIERVKRILMAGAKQAIEEKGLLKIPEPKVVVSNISDFGIEYTLKFWIVPWDIITPAEAKDKIISKIITHLAKSGLSLAYPKNDVFITQMPSRQTDIFIAQDRLKIISNVELFKGFNEAELQALSEKIKYSTYSKGDEIIKEGESGSSMFVLVEGLLNVFVKSQNVEMIQVGQLIPGQFFGEMSMLTGEKRSATVIASTDVLVFEITKESVASILQNREELIKEVSEFITERHEINVIKLKEHETRKVHIVEAFMNKIKGFLGIKQ